MHLGWIGLGAESRGSERRGGAAGEVLLGFGELQGRKDSLIKEKVVGSVQDCLGTTGFRLPSKSCVPES